MEQEDEFWMNYEGIAIKTCHRFSKESETKNKVNHATKTLGLTSRKNEVMLFTRAATCALSLFPLQAMSGVPWVCRGSLGSSDGHFHALRWRLAEEGLENDDSFMARSMASNASL